MSIEALLVAVEAAIQRIPISLKAAYLEAKTRAADLLEVESDPKKFLCCEDGNVGKAARRLVLYWKQRRELFGDRAFRPMIQTGTGALSESDVEILKAGGTTLLPTDLDGRHVLYFNRDQLTKEQVMEEEARSRCFFYLLHVACQDEVTQTKGIVVLSSVTNRMNEPINDARFGKLCIAFAAAMPMRVHHIHLLAVAQTSAFVSIVDGLMAIEVKMISPFVGYPTDIHRGPTPDHIYAGLEKYSIPKRSVHQEYGGTWTYEEFAVWCRKQLKVEAAIYLTAEEKAERKRQNNVIHSRQKRSRRKIEQEVLEGRAAALTSLNSKLKAKNDDLDMLLQVARETVRVHEEQLMYPPARIPKPVVPVFREPLGPIGAPFGQTAATLDNSLSWRDVTSTPITDYLSALSESQSMPSLSLTSALASTRDDHVLLRAMQEERSLAARLLVSAPIGPPQLSQPTIPTNMQLQLLLEQQRSTTGPTEVEQAYLNYLAMRRHSQDDPARRDRHWG